MPVAIILPRIGWRLAIFDLILIRSSLDSSSGFRIRTTCCFCCNYFVKSYLCTDGYACMYLRIVPYIQVVNFVSFTCMYLDTAYSYIVYELMKGTCLFTKVMKLCIQCVQCVSYSLCPSGFNGQSGNTISCLGLGSAPAAKRFQ